MDNGNAARRAAADSRGNGRAGGQQQRRRAEEQPEAPPPPPAGEGAPAEEVADGEAEAAAPPPPPPSDSEDDAAEQEDAEGVTWAPSKQANPGIDVEFLQNALPGIKDKRWTQADCDGSQLRLLTPVTTPGTSEDYLVQQFYMKRGPDGKLVNESLLFPRSGVQQVLVGVLALTAHAESYTGVAPRELAEGRSADDTRLQNMYAEDSGVVPCLDLDNPPPAAFRVEDESYETHRAAHEALLETIPLLRNLGDLCSALLDLMDRTHDPSRQSAEDKEELVQYRADLFSDLFFMRQVPWNATQRRTAVLERSARTELRRAAAKHVAARKLAALQRRAAAEAGGERKPAKAMEKGRGGRIGSRIGGRIGAA